MKKTFVFAALAVVGVLLFARSASALMPPIRPRPPVIILPTEPAPDPQPIQSAQ